MERLKRLERTCCPCCPEMRCVVLAGKAIGRSGEANLVDLLARNDSKRTRTDAFSLSYSRTITAGSVSAVSNVTGT